jgi:hypothetical protein
MIAAFAVPVVGNNPRAAKSGAIKHRNSTAF